VGSGKVGDVRWVEGRVESQVTGGNIRESYQMPLLTYSIL